MYLPAEGLVTPFLPPPPISESNSPPPPVPDLNPLANHKPLVYHCANLNNPKAPKALVIAPTGSLLMNSPISVTAPPKNLPISTIFFKKSSFLR